MKINNFNKERLLKYMKSLRYDDYRIFNSNIESVKKFWCALGRLWGVYAVSDIIDFITSYIKDSEIEFPESRIKKCERLSVYFLSYLSGRNLLKNE